MKVKVTARDVAAAAKVSLPAVTLAFRGYGRQKEETRIKILAVARELGYHPNLLVDSLRTGRTRTIGLMMSLKDTPALEMFNGITEVLNRHDHVPIVVTPDENNSEERQLHRLLERRVDGIILLPRRDAMYEEHLGELTQQGLPFVVMDSMIAGDRLSPCFVGTDDVGAGRAAARHLLELGHRRFGIFTADRYPKPMYFRQEGFAQEVAACADAVVFTVGTDLEDPRQAQFAAELLKTGPTAVFATTDLLLPALYQAAEELDMEIPDELSVVGVAGLPLTRYLRPTVTTMVQLFHRIGETAAELLLRQLDGVPIPETQVRYAAELRPGQSTKRPSAAIDAGLTS